MQDVNKKIRRLSRRLEEYIEAIYAIKYEEGKKIVRIKDIASRMNVSMASVTEAMHRLSDLGLVEYEKRGYVDLTEEGYKIAKWLDQREKILKIFLIEILGVNEKTAQEDACKMEHELSCETIDRILKLVKFLKEKAPKEFVEELRKYLKDSKDS